MIAAVISLGLLAGAQTPATQPIEAADIDLAVRVCDTWLGKPATWADHIPEFPKRSGLDISGLRSVATLPHFASGMENVPAAHLWKLKTPRTTLAIVTSDVRPICTFAAGEVLGAFAASSAWAESAGADWKSDHSAGAPPPGMRGISLIRPKDGGMPARLLVFSAQTSPTADGHDLQLLATEALQLDQ